MNEIWKAIDGFEGLYEVSNLGNVRSLNYRHTGRSQILKLEIDHKGYLMVGLCNSGKRKVFKVHRLVASAFLPNSQNLPEVNHKDENKQNNCVDNLDWMSHKDNQNYGTRNQRVAEALRGKKRKPFSDEHKRKMSEAQKRRWQNKKTVE